MHLRQNQGQQRNNIILVSVFRGSSCRDGGVAVSFLGTFSYAQKTLKLLTSQIQKCIPLS